MNRFAGAEGRWFKSRRADCGKPGYADLIERLHGSEEG
jgi:hypothetical protein